MKKIYGLLIACAVVASGCHTDMWVQPRAQVQGESTFFADRMDARPKVAGTVARGQATVDPAYVSGYNDGKLVDKVPAEQAMKDLGLKTYRELLERGKERYEIFCSHCHGGVGDGKGMIAQRGLEMARPVATYHTDRLRKIQDGHIFDAITNGYGVMFSQKDRVPVEDRWAIVTYVRALQRSQAPTKMSASGVKQVTSEKDNDL